MSMFCLDRNPFQVELRPILLILHLCFEFHIHNQFRFVSPYNYKSEFRPSKFDDSNSNNEHIAQSNEMELTSRPKCLTWCGFHSTSKKTSDFHWTDTSFCRSSTWISQSMSPAWAKSMKRLAKTTNLKRWEIIAQFSLCQLKDNPSNREQRCMTHERDWSRQYFWQNDSFDKDQLSLSLSWVRMRLWVLIKRLKDAHFFSNGSQRVMKRSDSNRLRQYFYSIREPSVSLLNNISSAPRKIHLSISWSIDSKSLEFHVIHLFALTGHGMSGRCPSTGHFRPLTEVFRVRVLNVDF